MIFIGIGKNYVDKIEDKPVDIGAPTIFTKPENSALLNNQDLVLPTMSDKVEYELELAFRIGKEAKNVAEDKAWDYVDAVTLAIDFTAKDLLATSREKKGPWALAKGFDGATPLSEFQPISNFADRSQINFSLDFNGERLQTGDSRLMITSVPAMIAYVSHLVGKLEGELLMDFKIV